MPTTEAHIEKLGDAGERCAACSAPLAEDQRYCLNCGERRGNARLPFLDVLREQWASEGRGATPPTAPPPRRGTGASESNRNWTPLIAGAGGGIAALVLGVGFLIGQSGDSPRPASRPQIVQVGGGAGNAPVAAFQEDWPQGKDGWTVQLQALPKASTQPAQVASAKTAAQTKGAADVGALDADQHGLDAGTYIVYSGVFDDEKAAKKALDKHKGSFPDAKVIQVSGSGGGALAGGGGDKNALSGGKGSAKVDRSQLQRLQGLSPQDYAKQSRKLPDETILPGNAPPTDNAAPGGGSSAETIR